MAAVEHGGVPVGGTPVGGVLVGRHGELDRLATLVADLADGRGGSVWVEGEPGIGKSALLAAGLAGARELGCQVFWAAADELGQRFPLRVVLDCLQVAPESDDPLRREVAELLQPDTGSSGTTLTDLVPAAVERLLSLVDRMCAAAPVLLVVDDLQWADEASVLVWHRLGRAVRQLPLLLAAACRPVPHRAELVQLRRSLLASGVVSISLGPLQPSAVAELAGGLAQAGSLGPRLRAVLEHAGGNPLYVRELLDALSREGWLQRRDDAADLVGDAPSGSIPASLAAAVSARLRFVPDGTMYVLRAAALLGVEFSVSLLAVVVGRSPTELALPVEEAMAAGVLTEAGVRLAFRHALIRQALYTGIPAGARLAMHAQAARALADAGAAVEAVAEQLLAALPGTGTDAAQAAGAAGVGASERMPDWLSDWLLGPGRSVRHRTPQVAADLLGRAAEHLPPADSRREELQTALASVLFLLGRYPEAVRVAEQVLAGTVDPERAAQTSWTLGWALLRMQRYEQAEAVAGRALRDTAPGTVWAARLRALLPMIAASRGDFDQASAARQALAEADQAGDRLAAAAASNTLFVTLDHRGDSAGALAALEHGLAALGDEPETADLRLILMHNRRSTLSHLDRLAEADAAVRELLATGERFAAPARMAGIRLSAADHYYQVGRWDDALAEMETVAEETVAVPPLFRLFLHGVWALVAGHRDEQAVADAQVLAAADQPLLPGEAYHTAEYLLMARALLAERAGDPRQAVAVFAGMLDPAHADELTERRLWLPDAVRLALTVDDPATARTAAEVSAADAGAEPTPSRTATAQHCRGLLDGDPAPLVAAADAYRSSGCQPLPLAQTLEDAAVLLAQRGDLPAARAAYAEAADRYTALGAGWDLRRAETRLRPHNIRRPRAAPRRRVATGWDALTPTEVTVARHVATGMANPDIAASLSVSRRTVEVHVSHILAKLGVRSRVEIVRDAASHQPSLTR